MKSAWKTAVLATAMATVFIIGTACSDDKDDDPGPVGTPSVPETVLPNPPGSPTDTSRDEFIERVNNQIDRMETRMAEIEEESKGLTGDAREEADRQVAELKSEVDDLRERLAEFEGASGDDIEKIKDEIDGKLNELQAEIENLADQFGI